MKDATITNGRDKFNTLLKGWSAYYKEDAQLLIDSFRNLGYSDSHIARVFLKNRKSRESLRTIYPKGGQNGK